jgi:hypothetical protein
LTQCIFSACSRPQPSSSRSRRPLHLPHLWFACFEASAQAPGICKQHFESTLHACQTAQNPVERSVSTKFISPGISRRMGSLSLLARSLVFAPAEPSYIVVPNRRVSMRFLNSSEYTPSVRLAIASSFVNNVYERSSRSSSSSGNPLLTLGVSGQTS